MPESHMKLQNMTFTMVKPAKKAVCVAKSTNPHDSPSAINTIAELKAEIKPSLETKFKVTGNKCQTSGKTA